MNRRILIFAFAASLLAAIPMLAMEAHKWLHIERKSRNFHSLKASDIKRISHLLVDSVGAHEFLYSHPATSADKFPAKTIRVAPSEYPDLDIPVVIPSEPEFPPVFDHTLIVTQANDSLLIPTDDIVSSSIGSNVPTISITLTDYPERPGITSVEGYFNASFTIDGNGLFDDVDSTFTQIKVRGNSTAEMPKKPYRLKLSKKASLLGMKKAKSYVLIANYIDGTLLKNALAFRTAEVLGMEFFNSWIPVRVIFNGKLHGAYFLSEKLGTGSASVDIDEQTGVLLEIDAHMDEDYQFRSEPYNLPVMVKDPDLEEIAEELQVTPDSLLTKWQNKFNKTMDDFLHANAPTAELFDLDAVAKFVIVHSLTLNREMLGPNSVHAYYKNEDDVLHFGPVWDFDWTCGYDEGDPQRLTPKEVLLTWDNFGFWTKFLKDPAFREVYDKKWDEFVANDFEPLILWLREQADVLYPSAKENGMLWPPDGWQRSSWEYTDNVETLIKWLRDRVEYCNSHPAKGLYYAR